MRKTLLCIFLLAMASTARAETGHDHHADHGDGRQALRLNAEEMAHVRLEMRTFLSGVQEIVSAVAGNDPQTIARSARKLGVAAAHEVPAELRRKLPLEFKKLGSATHHGFDDLARDAESLGDANHALRQLGQIMQNCVSCHATFRLETAEGMH